MSLLTVLQKPTAPCVERTRSANPDGGHLHVCWEQIRGGHVAATETCGVLIHEGLCEEVVCKSPEECCGVREE